MTIKKYVTMGAAVFGILFVGDFLVHGILLKGAYQATASLWRPVADLRRLMWTTWVLYLVNALVLPYIFAKGYETGKRPFGQGLRFGAAIGLLMASGMSLGTYLMIAIPASLAIAWFITSMIEFALVGIALALIY
jgi:hypothetical protein